MSVHVNSKIYPGAMVSSSHSVWCYLYSRLINDDTLGGNVIKAEHECLVVGVWSAKNQRVLLLLSKHGCGFGWECNWDLSTPVPEDFHHDLV